MRKKKRESNSLVFSSFVTTDPHIIKCSAQNKDRRQTYITYIIILTANWHIIILPNIYTRWQTHLCYELVSPSWRQTTANASVADVLADANAESNQSVQVTESVHYFTEVSVTQLHNTPTLERNYTRPLEIHANVPLPKEFHFTTDPTLWVIKSN